MAASSRIAAPAGQYRHSHRHASHVCYALLGCAKSRIKRTRGMSTHFDDDLSGDEGSTTVSNAVGQASPAVPSVFSDFDLYLFGQGKHYRIYEKMGAHLREVDGVIGVNFAVWAPNAL